MYTGPTINPTFMQLDEIVDQVPKDKLPWPLERSKFFESKYTGEGTVGAILDTGTGSHQDIDGNCLGRITPYGDERVIDNGRWFEHGTFVAGEVHSTENGKGVVGAAYKAKFYDIQALPSERVGNPFSYLADAIDKAISLDVDVINMSLGSTYDSSAVKARVKRAYSKGIIMVAAAGNSGRGGKIVRNYPSDYQKVISVGSVNKKDLPSSFTQFSKSVFVSIGGENLYGIVPGDEYGKMSGTSMASPLIYGVALRWCEKHPEIKKKDRPKKFMEELKTVVMDIYKDGWDNRTGWGYLLDVPKIAMYPKSGEGPNFIIA